MDSITMMYASRHGKSARDLVTDREAIGDLMDYMENNLTYDERKQVRRNWKKNKKALLSRDKIRASAL